MNAIARKRISVYDLVMVALFAALIAVCAWVTVPGSVPFTLQTMGVFLAVGLDRKSTRLNSSHQL